MYSMSIALRVVAALIWWVLAASFVTLDYGCLYIANGSAQDVQFRSLPTGAQVTVNGVQHGTTPTVVSLSRCEAYSVTIAKYGYTPVGVRLGPTTSGPDTVLSFMDEAIVLPGLVDKWNCSAGSLRPDPVDVELLLAGAPPTTIAPQDQGRQHSPNIP